MENEFQQISNDLLIMICPGKILLIVIQFILLLVAGINIYQTGKEIILDTSGVDVYTLVFPSIVFLVIFSRWFILPFTKKTKTPVK